jgi:flagellar biosynthesis/type III secretory pathway protein FliH
MNVILKAHRVRLEDGRKQLAAAVTGKPSPNIPLSAAPPDGRTAEIEALNARLAAFEARCATLEDEREAAYRRGVDDGVREANTSAKRDDDARIDALSRGVQDARASLQTRFASLESLALDIAQVALERILGATEHYPALVAQTIRHHVAQMETGVVLTVDVSRADFPDDEALRPISAAAPESIVNAHPHLPAGACRFGLAPGRAELDLPRQRDRLLTILDRLRNDADPTIN